MVFASAYDGWAFGVEDFVGPVATKTGLSEQLLRNTLWGDFALKLPDSDKTKGKSGKGKGKGKSKSKGKGTSESSAPKVVQIKRRSAALAGGATAVGLGVTSDPGTKKARRPMAAELVLDSLWRAYRYGRQEPNPKKASKLAKQFGAEITEGELVGCKDATAMLRCLMRAWLPLPKAIMRAVAKSLPSPDEAAPIRIDRIMPEVPQRMAPRLRSRVERVRRAVAACDGSDDAPCVAFVSKMVAVPKKQVPAPL